MISKASVLILGILEQRALNPYELIKVLRIFHVNDWFNIADSTVYATIKKLCKGGYLEGELSKNGNMPEKTVYSVTEKGRKQLGEQLVNALSTFSYDVLEFSVAALFFDFFEKKEILKLLEERLIFLEKYECGIDSQINYLKNENIPILFLADIKRNKKIITCEKEVTKDYIDEIAHMQEWSKTAFKNIEIVE
ncbi:PadR family transcriptional regulator [Clostridium sp. SHJSY1]|uniref:PadR family transcriptional regulator n=1 Tax=Clostridium sp. SHJSY1 TaxID=2942483 RepID=UPI002874F3C3|nr:PadR family transcriptional regulator [Clostridium sp. SHJSY1]MDS0527088.1 PadR family transcriptional regulator [Clostridium sp. SHJSY1]